MWRTPTPVCCTWEEHRHPRTVSRLGETEVTRGLILECSHKYSEFSQCPVLGPCSDILLSFQILCSNENSLHFLSMLTFCFVDFCFICIFRNPYVIHFTILVKCLKHRKPLFYQESISQSQFCRSEDIRSILLCVTIHGH